MKNVLKFISMLTVMTIALLVTSCENFGRKPLPPIEMEEEYYEEEQITPEQACENMLVVREQAIWDHACDSIFRVMPEKIIIYITLHNPEFGTWDIGNEYLLKKELYDKLNDDIITVQEFEKQRVNTKPDSLPDKPEPNTKTKPTDTITTI